MIILCVHPFVEILISVNIKIPSRVSHVEADAHVTPPKNFK